MQFYSRVGSSEAVEGSCGGHGGSLGTEFRAVGACGFLGPRTSTPAQFDTSSSLKLPRKLAIDSILECVELEEPH